MADESASVTQLCARISRGDDAAQDRLFWLVYSELHQLARATKYRRRPNHSLQSGELVNEAYLKLVAGDAVALARNRAFFFAAAARAMRQVLIDYDRKWKPPRTTTPPDVVPSSARDKVTRLRALDRALDELSRHDPSLAEIVELRIFAGKTIKQVSELCGKGTATVERRFRAARAFLRLRIEEHMRNDDSIDDYESLGDL